MNINNPGKELGSYLGQNVANTNKYKDDFVESEDVTDITLASLNSVTLTGSWYAYSAEWRGMFIVYHPVYGVVGSSTYPVGNPLILGHPVYGLLGTGWLGGSAVYSSTLLASGMI